MLKNPLKRHSRYMTFDAIAGYVDHSTVSTREIYAFPTTLSILRQYAQKALCTKTPLSRGETGKTFTDTENKKTRPSVRVHWVACGTCTVPDNFFQVGRSLRSHTRRGPLAHRSSHVRATKQTCPCVICSSNSARYCFDIVYHCSAMVEVLGK